MLRFIRCGSAALVTLWLLVVGAAAQPVLDGCIQDTYNAYGPGGTLNCTANDVSIVDIVSLTVLDNGCAYVGDTVTFDAQFLVEVNAQQRQDIGFYIAMDGGEAITGTCYSDTLSLGDPGVVDLDGTNDDTTANNAFGYCSPDAGATLSSPIQPCNENSDCATLAETCEEFGPGIQDVCGDMDQANAGTCSVARTTCAVDADCPPTETCQLGTAVTTVQNVTVTCADDDGDGFADLKYSASWRIQGNNELCLSPLAAFPGNASKCKAGIPNSPIPIADHTLSVTKVLTPASDPGLFDLAIDAVVQQADVGNGGTTGPVSVAPGVHTVSEAAGTGTVLAQYASDITCTETVGHCVASPSIACLADPICDQASSGDTCDLTPVTVASCTGCTSVPVSVPAVQSAIACTISNVHHCDGVDCSGLDDACNVGQCNLNTGSCEAVPLADGTACDDATVCNGLETCQSGVCQPGTPLACDDANVCNGIESCDPVAGCQPGVPLVCDDNDVCNGAESCDALAGCQAGVPLVCDNNDVCDGLETCDALAGCQPGVPLVCDDNDVCNGAESCDALAGCQPGVPLVCDNNDVCDGVETCDALAGCQAGVPLVCDNGQFCDGVEGCDALTGCTAGVPPDCTDGVSCTVDLCDEGLDQCSHLPNDLLCDDGVSCTVDSCNPLAGCQNPANDALCDDGAYCNGQEVCNPLLGCEAGFAVVCPDDGFSCTNEFCDEATDQCAVDNTCQCGNGVVEPGEQCDPPSSLEDCNNMVDDDGDGAIDCADSDCRDPLDPNLGIDTCGEDCMVDLACQQIQRDPAKIVFGRNGRLDKFVIHGRVLQRSSLDLATAPVSVMVTNANGTVLQESLPAGSLQHRFGKSYVFKDRDARLNGGIMRVRVKYRRILGVDYVHFFLVAWGDYSAATTPTMTTQIVIGDHTGTLTRDWTPTWRGWKLLDQHF